jgi:hypothetical protein
MTPLEINNPEINNPEVNHSPIRFSGGGGLECFQGKELEFLESGKGTFC